MHLVHGPSLEELFSLTNLLIVSRKNMHVNVVDRLASLGSILYSEVHILGLIVIREYLAEELSRLENFEELCTFKVSD